MKALREKLTYANVIATLALVIAVAGGSALAATRMLPKNSVGTRQIKNHAVTRAKIKIASLGTVPSATAAVHASSADNAVHATSADSAGHATSADSAANAESLGGLRAAAYAKAELEPIHTVGAPGQPGFEGGCANEGGNFGEVGFYRDGFGIVHLVGLASCPTLDATIFTLPPGFRPTVDNLMVVATGETTTGEVAVLPNGEVRTFAGHTPRLFGLTFRAAS
ncbi:MAG: hypothetical protein JSS68_09410 [Actinobacteria bacterium]|nr:hypothetical protein [Actinomycetota bacterium]